MLIPWQAVSAEALEQLLQSVVLREGTDYGDVELTFADKVAHLKQQLLDGSVVIIYSELHETVDILPKALYLQRLAQQPDEHDGD